MTATFIPGTYSLNSPEIVVEVILAEIATISFYITITREVLLSCCNVV